MTDHGTCIHCGAIVIDGALYCSRCASSIERDIKSHPDYQHERDEYLADLDDYDLDFFDEVPV